MDRVFNIWFIGKGEDTINARFYSQKCVELRVSQIKAYYEKNNGEEYLIQLVPVHLDNNDVVKCFGQFKRPVSEYSSLNFIVKDKTNKLQFKIQLPLLRVGTEAKYEPMVYEGL